MTNGMGFGVVTVLNSHFQGIISLELIPLTMNVLKFAHYVKSNGHPLKCMRLPIGTKSPKLFLVWATQGIFMGNEVFCVIVYYIHINKQQ